MKIKAAHSNTFKHFNCIGIKLEVIEHPFDLMPSFLSPKDYYLCVTPDGELVILCKENDNTYFISAMNEFNAQ